MSANNATDPKPVYVYGVVPAEASVSVGEPGVAGNPVEVVAHDGVAAVLSDFPPHDPRVRRRDLRAHLRTLELVLEQTVVAACPFGTVFGSRSDVEERFLAPRRDELRRLLERLEGHVQVNVKAEYDEEAVLRELAGNDDEIAASRARARTMGPAAYYENIRLGELVSARLAERRASDREQILARLSEPAADAAPDPPDGDQLVVFKGSFLVDRDRLPEFDAALEHLAAAEADRLRFEEIGPLPPTAFARLGPQVP